MKILKLAAMSILALVVLSSCQPIGYGPTGYNSTYSGYKTCPPPLPDAEGTHSDARSNNKEDCDPTYTFMPPGDYAGDGCIKLCQRRGDKCQEDAQRRYESCKHFNKMAEIEFGRCIASGLLDCYNNVSSCPSTRKIIPKCEAAYRDCYASCGGMVENSCDEVDDGNDGNN